MKWQRVSVGSISKVVTKGTTPTTIGFNFAQEGIPFLRVQNIQNGNIVRNDILFIDANTDQALARSRIQPNDVLISIAGTIGRAAVVPLDATMMNCNQAVAIVRLGENVNPYYFNYWLSTEDALQQVTGSKVTATISNLSLSCIKELKIPLPPLEEQQRIAAILDKADAVRRKRSHAIQLTEELLRATFLDMFGDPVTNPKRWKVVELGTVTESKLGKMLSEAARQGMNPIKYLGNSHVRWRSFNLEELPEMDFSDTELKRLDLKYGDLIICEGGEVGRCAIWRDQLSEISFQKALHRVRCQTTQVLPEYLQEYFVFMAERGGLISSTSSATIAHLTGVRLKQLPLPLPPVEQQKSFQQIYKVYENLKLKYQTLNNEYQNLFNSLLHGAFRGEL